MLFWWVTASSGDIWGNMNPCPWAIVTQIWLRVKTSTFFKLGAEFRTIL